jgi:hypothetical protein
MYMHRMRRWRIVNNHKPRRPVVVRIVEIPFFWELQPSVMSRQKRRIAEINSKTAVIHRPLNTTLVFLAKANVNLKCRRRLGVWSEFEDGLALTNGCVKAGVGICVGDACGDCGGRGIVVEDYGEGLGAVVVADTSAAFSKGNLGAHPVGVTSFAVALHNNVHALPNLFS